MVCNFLKQTFFFFTLCPTKEGNSFEAWFLVVVLELEQPNVWKVLTLKQCIFVWVCISPLSDVKKNLHMYGFDTIQGRFFLFWNDSILIRYDSIQFQYDMI